MARAAKPGEIESLKRFLAAQRACYSQNAADRTKLTHVGQASFAKQPDETELAAWTSVCRVVLNLHETITRY